MDFRIDPELCIACGECVRDCPVRIIGQEPGRVPYLKADKADQCLGCQHCLAVCPSGALSVLGLQPSASELLSAGIPAEKDFGRLIRGRRSVRRYRPDPLAREQLESLVRLAAHAPSAHNVRPLTWTVSDDPSHTAALRDETYSRLGKIVRNGQLPEPLVFFADFVRFWDEKKVDVLFRGAPHFVVASYPRATPSGEHDGIIALTTLDLAAACAGLGSLWNGLLRIAWRDLDPGFADRLGLAPEQCIAGVMLLGVPAVRYQRTVQYDDVKIHRPPRTDGKGENS